MPDLSLPPKRKRGDTYIMDQENIAEMARLVDQDRLITQTMGGLFQPPIDLAPVHDILDIACGPGGWAMDVARSYPDKHVTGVDISRLMITFARTQAVASEVPNTRFLVMDVSHSLRFPDASFDVINARLLFSFMRPQKWPHLVRECLRPLRPGGLLRLTECEMAQTNSPAFETLGGFLGQALKRAGQSFSPDGRTVGITPCLRNFLRDAGFERIQHEAYALDWSYGAPGHESTVQDFVIGLKLGQPFLVGAGVTTDREYSRLYEQAVRHMQLPDFYAIWLYLSAWGHKPPVEAGFAPSR